MKITLCQLNPLVGDVDGNATRVCEVLHMVKAESPDMIVFPELFLQGYPPRDLLDQTWFIRNSVCALQKICEESRLFPQTAIVLGAAVETDSLHGRGFANAAIVIHQGVVVFQQSKSLLPTYDVFDESRYFDAAATSSLFHFKGEKIGLSICEDAWNIQPIDSVTRYQRDPVSEQAALGATLFINISASPFHMGKEGLRLSLARSHAKRHRIPFVYVNQIGGNDELIFDGNSMVVDEEGNVRSLLPSFVEEVRTIDTNWIDPVVCSEEVDPVASVYHALVLGVRDYMKKCGFRKALVGLSGGIDSAVTCAIAADAIGPENVRGVAMPSRYSSEGSVADATVLAENLGVKISTIPIEKPFNAFLETLAPEFAGTPAGIAEENLQARIRGTILMALSNKFGCLVLTTGNKSELAVGYCTLYGDMNGGLSVISDLPKGMVYKLAGYINSVHGRVRIPLASIEKAPSAELRAGQLDQDTLPPYPVLDVILESFIEKGLSTQELIEEGFDAKTVAWVARAIRLNEYKRRQAAPGLKVTTKAFGVGRRFPIAAKYDW